MKLIEYPTMNADMYSRVTSNYSYSPFECVTTP